MRLILIGGLSDCILGEIDCWGNEVESDMRIGLLNLEPKYKNLAIEKLRLYHQQQGDKVEDYFALCGYDKVYASSIFTFTKKDIIPQGAICGGSGFDLTTVLPSEIEDIKPRLNFGFTTRGCIRHCSFCIVPQKEGHIRPIAHLYDLWDEKSKLITLYDNNILALPQHFEIICSEAIHYGITLDFNQGLDHRLLTNTNVKLLKAISHKEYHFAFDHPSYQASVERALVLLKEAGINRAIWYVLVGFNTSPEEDLQRLNYLRNMGQRAFVQRYDKNKHRYFYQAIADWSGFHNLFATKTFEEFLELRSDRIKNRKDILLSSGQ